MPVISLFNKIALEKDWSKDLQIDRLLAYIDKHGNPDIFRDFMVTQEGVPAIDLRDESKTSKGALRKKVFEALRALNIDRVEVEYSGGGDEGNIEEVNAFGGDEIRHDLHGDICDLCEAWIEERHTGYQDGCGGRGFFEFNVAADTVAWSHSDIYEEDDTVNYRV